MMYILSAIGFILFSLGTWIGISNLLVGAGITPVWLAFVIALVPSGFIISILIVATFFWIMSHR